MKPLEQSIQPVSRIEVLVNGKNTRLYPKSRISSSDPKNTHTIYLSERELRQLLNLFVGGVYAWEDCNPCNFNRSPWTLNQDPTTTGWNVPVFEFVGKLDRQAAHEYTLRESELIRAIREGSKPLREGQSNWKKEEFREDRFDLEIRLKKNEIIGILKIPRTEPNPHILSFLRTLWGPPDKDLTPTIRRLKGNLFLL